MVLGVIPDCAEHVPNQIVVAVVRVEDDRTRLRRLRSPPGGIATVPEIAERRDEVRGPVDVIRRQANPVISLPQDERVAHSVMIGTRLLPLWAFAIGRIPVIEGEVVGTDTADASLVHHRGGNVLEDVVLDQIVRAVVGVNAIALRCRLRGSVEVAVANRDVDALIEPDVLVVTVQVSDVLEPVVVAIDHERPGSNRGAGAGVIH